MNNIQFINHTAYLKSSACIIQELCDFYSHLSVILSQYHKMFEITDVTLRLSLSSVKWRDPGHFLKCQDKFFLSFP